MAGIKFGAKAINAGVKSATNQSSKVINESLNKGAKSFNYSSKIGKNSFNKARSFENITRNANKTKYRDTIAGGAKNLEKAMASSRKTTYKPMTGGKAATNIASAFSKNFQKELGSGIGTPAKTLLAKNVGNIAGGAVIGAGVNAVRGEDAWQGAKTGAIAGGVYGGTKMSLKAGLGNSHMAQNSIAQGVKDFGKNNRVSNSVYRLEQLGKNSATVVTNNLKRKG